MIKQQKPLKKIWSVFRWPTSHNIGIIWPKSGLKLFRNSFKKNVCMSFIDLNFLCYIVTSCLLLDKTLKRKLIHAQNWRSGSLCWTNHVLHKGGHKALICQDNIDLINFLFSKFTVFISHLTRSVFFYITKKKKNQCKTLYHKYMAISYVLLFTIQKGPLVVKIFIQLA